MYVFWFLIVCVCGRVVGLSKWDVDIVLLLGFMIFIVDNGLFFWLEWMIW